MPGLDNKKLHVLLTGGGTGGHIYPAIAVYERLAKDSDVDRISYIGCDKNLEKKIAEENGIDFYSVSVSGMPRKLGIALLKWTCQLGISIVKAILILSRIKPDVILGTGGYVSAPVLISAKILKIPFGIHEPDANPGIVNRLMAPYAEFVSIAFSGAKQKMKTSKTFLNGNPLRLDFSTSNRETSIQALGLNINKKTLLVIGGSQGAKSINTAVLEAVEELSKNDIQIIHQAGAKNYDSYIKELEERNINPSNYPNYMVRPFFSNMPEVMAVADIALSRAGSLSISEICLNGLPSILIPYPYAAADHQRKNAREMETAGASMYIEDSELNGQTLYSKVIELLKDNEKLSEMRNISSSLAKSEAAEQIISLLKVSVKK